MIKIFLARDEYDGQVYIASKRSENTRAVPTDLSESDLIDALDGFRFKDAFYTKDTDNLNVKMYYVAENKNETTNITLCFKDYSKFKGTYIYDCLNEYIYNTLKKHAKKASKKLALKGIKSMFICASCGLVIYGGVKLYTTGIFTEDTEQKDSSSIVIEDSSMDDSSIEELVESSMIDDTNVEKTGNKEVVYADESSVSEKKDINNEEIDDLSQKFYLYASYFNFDEVTTKNLYLNNIEKINNSSNKYLEIINVLYDYYTENLYDSVYDSAYIIPNTATDDEMNAAIINYAHINGVYDEEILYTMLAVHELETGYGTSPLCLEDNNLGGNTYGDGFQTYPTYQVGAMDFVSDFIRIYEDTYNEYNTIEYNMNPVYCTENMPGVTTPWYQEIAGIKETLRANNELDKINSMLDEEKVKSLN